MIYRCEALWYEGETLHSEDLGDFRDIDAAWAAFDAFADETNLDVTARIRVLDDRGREVDVM